MILDNEKAILSCLIKDKEIINEIMINISKDDFTEPELKQIFSICKKQYEKHGEIDIFKLVNEFSKELISELSIGLDTTSDYQKYIKNLKDESTKRKMLKSFENYKNKLISNDFEDIDSIKTKFVSDFNNIDSDLKKQNNPTIEHMTDYIKYIEANKEKGTISSGFSGLDYALNGGIYSGLYVIGAISTLGKTALSLQIADNIAKTGKDVLFFSLEMSRYELMSRSISRILFQTDTTKFKEFGVKEIINGEIYIYKNDLNNGLQEYEDVAKNLTIYECNFGMTIESIANEVKNYIVRTGRNPVVFVDYLQIIQTDLANNTKKDGIDNIIVGLKKISVDNDIPVFTVSSFSRGAYYNRCTMASFKESGGIEYTADVVIGLQFSILDNSEKGISEDTLEKEKDNNPRQITALILKNRRGKAYAKQKLRFYPKNNLFVES